MVCEAGVKSAASASCGSGVQLPVVTSGVSGTLCSTSGPFEEAQRSSTWSSVPGGRGAVPGGVGRSLALKTSWLNPVRLTCPGGVVRVRTSTPKLLPVGAVRSKLAVSAYVPSYPEGRLRPQAAGHRSWLSVGTSADWPASMPASLRPPSWLSPRRSPGVPRSTEGCCRSTVRKHSRSSLREAGVFREVVDHTDDVDLRKAEAGRSEEDGQHNGQSDGRSPRAAHDRYQTPFQKTPPGVTEAHLREVPTCPVLSPGLESPLPSLLRS